MKVQVLAFLSLHLYTSNIEVYPEHLRSHEVIGIQVRVEETEKPPSPQLSKPLGWKSNMGLSHYPDPADAGILCIILVNTAKYISAMKEMVRFILQTIGIHVVSWEEYNITDSPLILIECHESSSEASIEEFRSRIPAMHYDSLCSKQLEHDCSVCLSNFRPKAVINHLSCGHVFHKVCVEKWIKYQKVTCPNCRTNMIHQEDEEEEEDTCPM